MVDKLRCINESIADIQNEITDTDSRKSLSFPCILQHIQDQCPSFGSAFLCECGLCTYAADDHQQFPAALGLVVVHHNNDNETRSTLMKGQHHYVTLRHDGCIKPAQVSVEVVFHGK